MFARSLLLLAATAVAVALAATPASAQVSEVPAPGAEPGACTDSARPSSGFTRKAARRAGRHGRRHVLRGTARDSGCGVDEVRISVSRKQGKRCRHLTRRGHLSKPGSCAKRRWLAVRGTNRWSFRLPRRLPRGAYLVRTRAEDLAGNLQRAKNRRLRLR
jgi:nitrogen fixation protein FixH